MRRRRAWAAGVAVLLVGSLAGAASGNARHGPYPQTALSRNNTLIWFTGQIDLTGHTFRDLDSLCRNVPVREVSGWRAPTEAEVRTLFVELHQNNGIARWSELYPDGQTLEPAVPPFDPSARLHGQINIMVRDVFTYEGQPTTLDQVQRGHMYIIHWFNRWTTPTFDERQTIRYAPGDYRLGPNERLLCVADYAPAQPRGAA